MTEILVLGAGGMLGSQLVQEFQHQKVSVTGLNHLQCDVTQLPQVTRTVEQHRPKLVFNCAAYTAVDAAESNEADAFAVNALGADAVATVCARTGARCVYISTDYVFDGRKAEPYLESDTPAPLNAYGRSKLDGERRTAMVCAAAHVIVRTSGLYGGGGRNFVDAMLQRARRGEPVRVVSDQIGAPTSTFALARTLAQLASSPHANGIFHATCTGECSWFQFAQAIYELTGASPALVTPILSRDYPGPAARPKNSRLANTRLPELGIGPLPHWRTALEQYIDGLRLEQC